MSNEKPTQLPVKFEFEKPQTWDFRIKGILIERVSLDDIEDLHKTTGAILKANRPGFSAIIKVIAEYCQLSEDQILGKNRAQPVVWARQLAIVMAAEFFSSLDRASITKHFKRSPAALNCAREAVNAYAKSREGRAELEKIRALVRASIHPNVVSSSH